MTGFATKFGYGTAMLAALASFATPDSSLAQDEVADVLPAESSAPDAERNCPAPEEFILPTTGFSFTLPPDYGACTELAPPEPVRPPAPSLFRMVALPVGQIAQLQKWESARQVSVADRPGPWDELLAQANQVSSGNPLETVNRWVNWHVRYRDDERGDEWSSAPTTLARGYGDCEDFALAKLALLQELGVPSDDMYLVLLRDRRQGDHAVLAVKREGRLLILDNRTDAVLPAEQVHDYTPIVSYSGPFAWTYGTPAG